MDWKDKKVLVTGSAGFIGSHLTERLLELGADVTSFVRYNSRDSSGYIPTLKGHERINLIKGDIRELTTVKEAVRGQDIIFHLAASISVHYSIIHPYDVVETNTMGTLNVLTAAKDENLEKIVFTSSSEVYGSAIYVPIDEKHPLQAQSPYSASKIGGEKIAESFYKAYNLPIAIIRPFNTYGPRQSTRAVIPTVIAQMLTQDKINVGDINTVRDFTYVSDTVEGFIKIAESKNSLGEAINIGSGVKVSIGDMINKVTELLNKDVEIVVDEKRLRPNKSEVMMLIADNKKAEELLGWRPKVSLKEGLKRTIDWFSNSRDIYKCQGYVF